MTSLLLVRPDDLLDYSALIATLHEVILSGGALRLSPLSEVLNPNLLDLRQALTVTIAQSPQ